jgi:hypothetical protein
VWFQVSQSTFVNCWRKADILDNKNIDYSIEYYRILRQIYSKSYKFKKKTIYDLIASQKDHYCQLLKKGEYFQ